VLQHPLIQAAVERAIADAKAKADEDRRMQE
jgi:hypothetical protein